MKQYTIPNPCPEKWESFVSGEGAAFCKVCATDVVDFTHMTEEEIKAYFRQNTGSVCGRMTQDQVHPVKMQSTKRFGVSKRLLAVVAGFGLISTAFGQVKSPVLIGEVRPYPAEMYWNFSGRVLLEDKGLEGAIVVLKGHDISVQTDQEGYFNLEVYEGILKRMDTLELVTTYIGCKTDTATLVPLKAAKKEITTTIVLQESTEWIGEVVIRKKTIFGRLWYRIKKLF